jgi:uncharacterized coiled-coil protein SlyX
MSSRIRKGIAVAAGTGLAVGFGGGRKRQSLSMDNLPNDPNVTDRIERIEDRLEAVENASRRMQEAMDARLTAFEEAIDGKVSARMTALEKALIDQSTVITALSQRAVEAEANFQRLISAVERLFEQRGIEQQAITRPGQPGVSPAAFETHLNEALQSGPVVVPEGFRPRIVSEEEAKSPRNRRPLSRL